MRNKLISFKRTIINLEEALEVEKTSIVRDSAIKRYELCYELAWKSIQELLKMEGLVVCKTPRKCFKEAFKLGWIQNEIGFLEMAENRNLTTHVYHEELAEAIYIKLKLYLELFKNLASNLDE